MKLALISTVIFGVLCGIAILVHHFAKQVHTLNVTGTIIQQNCTSSCNFDHSGLCLIGGHVLLNFSYNNVTYIRRSVSAPCCGAFNCCQDLIDNQTQIYVHLAGGSDPDHVWFNCEAEYTDETLNIVLFGICAITALAGLYALVSWIDLLPCKRAPRSALTV
jgi:hypothetical protein